jgi:hypothetical protein
MRGCWIARISADRMLCSLIPLCVMWVVGKGWELKWEDRYVQSKLMFAGNFLFRGAECGDVGSHLHHRRQMFELGRLCAGSVMHNRHRTIWLLMARKSEFGVLGWKTSGLHGRVALRSNEAIFFNIFYTGNIEPRESVIILFRVNCSTHDLKALR